MFSCEFCEISKNTVLTGHSLKSGPETRDPETRNPETCDAETWDPGTLELGLWTLALVTLGHGTLIPGNMGLATGPHHRLY